MLNNTESQLLELKPLSSYLDLLLKVNSRVSTLKVTSTSHFMDDDGSTKLLGTPASQLGKTCTGKESHGFIDKLIFFTPHNITAEFVKQKCKELNLPWEIRKKLTKERNAWVLEIRHSMLVIDCCIGRSTSLYFNKIILNPAKIESVDFLFQIIEKIFGEDIGESKPYRIDFTLDYFVYYDIIKKELDVKYKQTRSVFFDGTNRKSGFQFGINHDKIIVYNKALEQGKNIPWTRIERQITGSKLKGIITKLSDLKNFPERILNLNLLSIVSRNHVVLVPSINPTEIQSKNINKFSVLHDEFGYFIARKTLNVNDNFQRDFLKQFLELKPFRDQPNDLYNADMAKFLGVKNDNE